MDGSVRDADAKPVGEARARFHIGDTVFVKSIGTVATIEKIDVTISYGERRVTGFTFSDLGGGIYPPGDLVLIKRSQRGQDAEFLQQAV